MRYSLYTNIYLLIYVCVHIHTYVYIHTHVFPILKCTKSDQKQNPMNHRKQYSNFLVTHTHRVLHTY